MFDFCACPLACSNVDPDHSRHGIMELTKAGHPVVPPRGKAVAFSQESCQLERLETATATKGLAFTRSFTETRLLRWPQPEFPSLCWQHPSHTQAPVMRPAQLQVANQKLYVPPGSCVLFLPREHLSQPWTSVEILPRARNCARLPTPWLRQICTQTPTVRKGKGMRELRGGGDLEGELGVQSFQRSLLLFTEEVTLRSWVLEDEQTSTCFRKFQSQLGPPKRNPALEELASVCTPSSRKESRTMNMLKYKTKRR